MTSAHRFISRSRSRYIKGRCWGRRARELPRTHSGWEVRQGRPQRRRCKVREGWGRGLGVAKSRMWDDAYIAPQSTPHPCSWRGGGIQPPPTLVPEGVGALTHPHPCSWRGGGIEAPSPLFPKGWGNWGTPHPCSWRRGWGVESHRSLKYHCSLLLLHSLSTICSDGMLAHYRTVCTQFTLHIMCIFSMKRPREGRNVWQVSRDST